MFFFELFPLLSALAICVSPTLSTPAPVAADAIAAINGPRCTHVLVPLTITANNAVGVVICLLASTVYPLREIPMLTTELPANPTCCYASTRSFQVDPTRLHSCLRVQHRG